MVFSYNTIAAATTSEMKDRGSKFLCFAYPVSTREQIKEAISSLKKEHPKANHHCVAYRLGLDGQDYRASDDGEPSGSAGRPMLGQIDSMGITNVLVVVVRYFGGTLLGVPGLIAAYKGCTHDALALAEIVERPIMKNILLDFEYPDLSLVMGWQKQYELEMIAQDMGLFCQMNLGVPLAIWDTMQDLLVQSPSIAFKEL